MRTIWHSLAWKEWHEHKWKLAALTAVLLGVSAVLFLNAASDAIEAYFAMLVYAIVPLAIFLGASDAADERGRGTLPLTQSLPAATWKHGCWKLAYGVGTCIVPIAISLLAVVIYCLTASAGGADLLLELERSRSQLPLFLDLGSPLANWSVYSGLLAAVAGVSFYLWTAAIGVNSKDSGRAGAFALLGIVVWWSVVGFTAAGIDREWPNLHGAPLVTVVLGISPGGLAIALFIAAGHGYSVLPFSVFGVITVGMAFHVALAAWFVVRFGRTEVNDDYSPQTKRERGSPPRWIGLPRRYTLTAIIWKQFRESTPIAVVGLAAIAFFFTANLLAGYEFYAGNEQRIVTLLASATMAIGFFVAMAAGIGVFDRDLGPQINEFWRSRPIQPDLWFWTKYLTGLGVVCAVLYLPLLVSGGTLAGPFTAIEPDERQMLYLHVAIYASALAGICLVRQPVYAGILGTGALLAAVGAVTYFFSPTSPTPDTTDLTTMIFAMEIAMTVFATLVAWLAVRYDWGHKGRY